MLTYHEIMTTDFKKLSSAADKWQSMAGEFKKVEKRYRDSIEKITIDDSWQGESATAAGMNFAATRYEYQAAQAQAKATATLLRNAHEQFTELKQKLVDARADAVKEGMRVSEQGNVSYDMERATPAERNAMRHDPDFAKGVRESEQSWAEYIKACVKAVDDADKDLQKDLEAVVKDSGGGKNDGTAGGFNGDAAAVAAADDKQRRDRMDLASFAMRENETLEDWLARIQRDGVEKLTGNKQLADLLAGVQKGTVTAGAFALALGTSLKGGFKLYQFLKKGKTVTAPGTFLTSRINERMMLAQSGSLWSKLPPGFVSALTGSEEAAALGSHMKNGKFFIPTAAEANLARVAQQGGLANAAKAAGWLRGAGVVGSAGATLFGVANLATYNTDMIKEDPGKFATDLSGTAFNASLTALAVAPNPVTVGLAVGTGLVYGGCLVWENREAIGDGLEKAGEWVGDKTEEAVDGLKKIGSALNPFD
ncbi:hypothetical protein [Streptomyces fradiae]|uniref:hypothetical protein n=1 Tax=Streptomyces fradiae TaxID=1906 RepID=UPI00294323AA|nr:hypothetical protein [Streptomyces fradiae]WOI59081.1 hypothetical protein RYQ63_03625 [Streptomyces fradiae]